MTNIDRVCAVCHQVVALGDAYFYTFTTGEYRHRACGPDTGRLLEELVSPAPSHTPPSMYEEIERLRVVNTGLLEALGQLVALLARDYITDSLRQEPRGVSPAGEAALMAACVAIAAATEAQKEAPHA